MKDKYKRKNEQNIKNKIYLHDFKVGKDFLNKYKNNNHKRERLII